MKLISGGQTGVDRAVLDVALERGIAYGGWCPKGGWAEDFPEPPGLLARYPELAETPLADPAQRTEWNVRDADACMIVVDAGGVDVSAGTALAQDLAHRYRKPVFVVNLGEPDTLNRAGSGCASNRPDIVTASNSRSADRARARRREFMRARRRSSARSRTSICLHRPSAQNHVAVTAQRR